MAYIVPSYSWHYSFEFLDQKAAPANVIFLGESNQTQYIRSTLAGMNDVSSVKVVDWNEDSYFGFETERFVALLSKHGRYLGSDQYENFQIHTYTDVALDRPWTFYEDPEPLAVNYDRGISLKGIAVGQGTEQLSSQSLLTLGQARTLWVTLYWETSPGMDIDYSISLRLYNAEGQRAYQADEVLRKTTDRVPTSRWSAQELVETLQPSQSSG